MKYKSYLLTFLVALTALGLAVLGIYVYSYHLSRPAEEEFPINDNPAKIEAIHYFEKGRAVAIVQEDHGDKGGISVGQRYAFAFYGRLRKEPSDYALDNSTPSKKDEYMYLDIYDLTSKSLKPKRINLFDIARDYQEGYLPMTINEPVLMIKGKEYCRLGIVRHDADAKRDKRHYDDLYIDLETGQAHSKTEVGGSLGATPTVRLRAFTDFNDKIAKYGFTLDSNGNNGVAYDLESTVKNSQINLIRENPKFKKLIYEDGARIYLLLDKSTEEEWVNTLLNWFSTTKHPLTVNVKKSTKSKEVPVTTYEEFMKAYRDTATDSSSEKADE